MASSAPNVHGGRCFGATIAVDGKEVSVDRWCREVREGNKLLAVLISYGVIFTKCMVQETQTLVKTLMYAGQRVDQSGCSCRVSYFSSLHSQFSCSV